MEEKERPSYFSILTADVRYDEDLKPNEKLLFSEITALTEKTGYCWASNNYFSSLYNVENETISRWIKNLRDKGYVETQLIYKNGSKEIDKRVITPLIKKSIPYCLNNQYPIDEKVKDNNTSNNNTSINNIVSKRFVPPTLEEVKAYINENNLNVDADTFYNYFTVGEWKDSKGNKVKNWKQKLITWNKHNSPKQKQEEAVPKYENFIGGFFNDF